MSVSEVQWAFVSIRQIGVFSLDIYNTFYYHNLGSVSECK